MRLHLQVAFDLVVQGIEKNELLVHCVPAFLALCRESSKMIAGMPNVAVCFCDRHDLASLQMLWSLVGGSCANGTFEFSF